MNQREYLKQMRWEGVKNTSGETCPPFGLMAITGSEQRGETRKRTVLLGAKPSTTFYREYVVNGPTAIPAGKYGRCTRMCGGLWMLYDDADGTPANGEGWGPKPGQWDAAKAFPGITCEGVKSASRTLLLGTLSPISTLLCKATDDLSAGAVSSDFQIWSGSIASGANSGFTTLPEIELQADVPSGDYFVAHQVNNGWVVPAGGGGDKIGKADGSIAAGGEGTVSIWTGTPGSETDSGVNITNVRNRTDATISALAWVKLTKINGHWYLEPWSCPS